MSPDPPFVPQTGNPEAHDYLDWYRHLVRTGQIVEPPAEDTAQQPPRPEQPPQDEPDTI